MANYFSNEIKVYGNEKNLRRFKNDLFGEEKSDFSFRKAHYENTDYGDYSHLNIYEWDIRNGSRKCDCLHVKIIEKENQLNFKYATKWGVPDLIYEDIIENYKHLDFKIYGAEETNDWAIEIVTSAGQYTKYKILKSDSVHWKKNLYIDFEYEEDFLNDNKITITNTYVDKIGNDESLSIITSGSNINHCEPIPMPESVDDLDDDALLEELTRI